MSRIWFLAACAALLLASGCVPTSQYVEMRSMYEEAASNNRELSKEIDRLSNEVERLTVGGIRQGLEKQSLLDQIAVYKNAGIWPDIPGAKGIRGRRGLRLPGLTFRSGSAILSPAGKAILDKVARVLRNKGKNILLIVDGHTDNDPVNVSRKFHASNWELSGKRAGAVVDYLVRGAALDPKKCFVRGFGEHQPISKVKSENRRVEIFYIPLTSSGAPVGPGKVIPATILK